MRLKKITIAGATAATLGLAVLAGGTAFAASPAPSTPVAAVESTSAVETDTVQLQQGDQTGVDTGTAAAESATSESATSESASSESATASDGPGGHADPAGDVNHQVGGNGQE